MQLNARERKLSGGGMSVYLRQQSMVRTWRGGVNGEEVWCVNLIAPHGAP